MGTWGAGAFENDGALDLAGDMASQEFSLHDVMWAFADKDYLEVDGGQMALALGEIAVAIRKGLPSPCESVDLAAVAPQFTPAAVEFIRGQVARTLSDPDHSELYELWEETEDFQKWIADSRATLADLA